MTRKKIQKKHRDIRSCSPECLRQRWLHALRGDDLNSITRQLNSIVWRMGNFSMIAQVRAYEKDISADQQRLKFVENDLINLGYVLFTVAGIRKLVETKILKQPDTKLARPNWDKDSYNQVLRDNDKQEGLTAAESQFQKKYDSVITQDVENLQG